METWRVVKHENGTPRGGVLHVDAADERAAAEYAAAKMSGVAVAGALAVERTAAGWRVMVTLGGTTMPTGETFIMEKL